MNTSALLFSPNKPVLWSCIFTTSTAFVAERLSFPLIELRLTIMTAHHTLKAAMHVNCNAEGVGQTLSCLIVWQKRGYPQYVYCIVFSNAAACHKSITSLFGLYQKDNYLIFDPSVDYFSNSLINRFVNKISKKGKRPSLELKFSSWNSLFYPAKCLKP